MNYANGRLYVSNSAGTSLAAINVTTPKLAGTITTGLGPAGSVLLGRNLYINNSKNKSVTIIDTGDLIATQISEPKVEIPVGA
jgi:YVTN family beta-propeller protein